MTATDGRQFTVRNPRQGDGQSLQAFNAALRDETRMRFYPHAYDEETVAKYIAHAAAGDNLIYVLWDDPPPRFVGYFFLWYYRQPVPLPGIGLLEAYQGLGLALRAISCN